jgi:CBS domain-containing protein
MQQQIKELMIGFEDYPVFNEDDPIGDAASAMRRIYCQAEQGKCLESGHRNVLIRGAAGNIVGVLDFWNVLSVLIPEAAGGLSKALEEMNVALAFAEAEETVPRSEPRGFKARVQQNAKVPCKKIMSPLKQGVGSEDSLLQGLKELHRQKVSVLPVYEGEKPVGVIRDSDLFLAAVSALVE